jgi:hypothetical protein
MTKRLGLFGVAALALGLNARPAAADPIFGPNVYVKVQPAGTPDIYSDSITVPANGAYAVWIQNGDDEGGRITSGSVVVGTTTIAGDVQFGGPREFFGRVVFLKAGTVPLTVTLNDPGPGAFLGLVVIPVTERFDFTVGRLLLPYADSVDTTLVLKNGAPLHNRSFRINYFDSAGTLQASSDRLTLAPQANVSGSAASFITTGSWTSGSITVFWAGQGPARMFGTATTIDPTSSQKGLVEMEHAGYRSRDFFKLINQ